MSRPAADTSLMKQEQQSTRRRGPSAWALPGGEARRIIVGPGPRCLQVESGWLWLTVTAEADTASEDQWLQAGDTVWLPTGAQIVIEGREDAQFALLVPPQACRGVPERMPVLSRLWALARRWRAASQWSRHGAAFGPYRAA
jgi:Protein of unknown function (DUF2917)